LAGAVYPTLARHVATGQLAELSNLARRLSVVAVAYAVFGAVLLSLASDLVVTRFFGESFAPSSSAVGPLLVGAAAATAFFWMRPVIVGLGQTGHVNLISALTMAAKLVLVLVAVPAAGFVGMAVVSSIATCAWVALVGGRVLLEISRRRTA
jgi:O-antigen/teichoic acid export membrane protein